MKPTRIDIDAVVGRLGPAFLASIQRSLDAERDSVLGATVDAATDDLSGLVAYDDVSDFAQALADRVAEDVREWIVNVAYDALATAVDRDIE